MKRLLLACLFLCSCECLSPKMELCGKVDTLEVYRKGGSMLSCKDALATTQAAYDILWQRGPGVLNESWQVEFMWGAIGADDPWGRTTYDKHLIQVQERAPRTILHELGHAFMSETHTGGMSQHEKMCADKNWQKLEREFEVIPYCHLVR